MRRFRTIRWALPGLMLSIALAGCAHPSIEGPPPPTAVAVAIEDKAPADLLICPEAPEGFPIDAVAVMPPPVRAATIRLAQGYAAASAQLARLIAWHRPGACLPSPVTP